MGTLVWMRVAEADANVVEGTWRTRKAGCCVDGSVRRVQSNCWPDTVERFDPIVVYRRGGTDKQKDLYKRYSTGTVVRRWPGSNSGWGANLQELLIEWKDIFSRHELRVRFEKAEVMWVGHRRKEL